MQQMMKYLSEDSLPYPIGSIVFFIADEGIMRGTVQNITIRITKHDVIRTWEVAALDADGERITKHLSVGRLAFSLDHILEQAEKYHPAFKATVEHA